MSADIPRLEFDQLEPALAEALRPRVERLGYLGEFFKCTAHQPEALRAFIEFTETAKGGLPKRLVETVALTCATYMGNAYERNQHERLSVRLGFGKPWVTAVEAPDPDAGALGEDEKRVQRYVLKALDSKGQAASGEFAQLVAALGHEQAIAVLMVTGRYVVHALVVNTLGLAPPVPSVFEDGFESD